MRGRGRDWEGPGRAREVGQLSVLSQPGSSIPPGTAGHSSLAKPVSPELPRDIFKQAFVQENISLSQFFESWLVS